MGHCLGVFGLCRRYNLVRCDSPQSDWLESAERVVRNLEKALGLFLVDRHDHDDCDSINFKTFVDV